MGTVTDKMPDSMGRTAKTAGHHRLCGLPNFSTYRHQWLGGMPSMVTQLEII